MFWQPVLVFCFGVRRSESCRPAVSMREGGDIDSGLLQSTCDVVHTQYQHAVKGFHALDAHTPGT